MDDDGPSRFHGSLEIRPVEAGEAALVERAGALFDHVPRADTTARFLASENHHLLLALEDDVPIGFVSGVEIVHPDKAVEMFLYELSVAEGVRGRGVGTALVRALADLARERGCRGMWVLTDDDNEAALKAYRRAGATAEESTRLLEWRF